MHVMIWDRNMFLEYKIQFWNISNEETKKKSEL